MRQRTTNEQGRKEDSGGASNELSGYIEESVPRRDFAERQEC
jgi:hypothetical protein